MNPSNWQLIGFQLVVIVPFLTGVFLHRRFPQLSTVASKIVVLNLSVFEPPIILWSIWGLKLRGELFLLPLAGVLMVTMGFCLGKFMAPLLIPDRQHRKVFVICASLSNHGFTMGGVICYLLMGEKGLALSAIFITYFIPYTFLFIFFYANMGAGTARINMNVILKFLLNIRNLPLVAVILAVGLQLLEIHRPAITFPLNTFLAISIGLYYFTLGINFNAGDLNAFRREQGLLAVIKFILIPIFAVSLMSLLNPSADIRRVVLIQSVMPVAVYAVMTSVIFNFKIRLATSLFMINTILFIGLLLPLLFWLQL